jgi:putative N-acetyltransferase (TIGR04045 family)
MAQPERSRFSTRPEFAADLTLEIAEVTCVAATTPEERALHHRIRHDVFVVEQGFFDPDDHDCHDEDPATIHVLAHRGGLPAGSVRLYPLEEDGLWKGDRLAVLAPFRRRHVGAPLVRFAVATAGALGGERMIAYIQPQNVAFFAYLGWHPVGDVVDYVGHSHQCMEIPLPP